METKEDEERNVYVIKATMNELKKKMAEEIMEKLKQDKDEKKRREKRKC